MQVQEAQEFVMNSVLIPAIESKKTTIKVKNVTKSQIPWIENFKKVGDIYKYLLSITKDKDNSVVELESLGLNTYESIIPEFEMRFQSELNDISTFDDFLLNESYSSREILSIVGQYDTRSGGIQLYKEHDETTAIAIKVTLNGGKYNNEWLINDMLLKYYMKSIGDVFNEDYTDNKMIINSAGIPIHTFVRESQKDSKFIYKGVFKYIRHFDDGGRKWFQLENNTVKVPLSSKDEINSQLSVDVKKAMLDTSEKRKKRLQFAPKKPASRMVNTVIYNRNPDVIAEVLFRANGICECCQKDAPFLKKSTQEPYLEVHHIIRLADGGDDTVANAIAVCPNCHRKQHFG